MNRRLALVLGLLVALALVAWVAFGSGQRSGSAERAERAAPPALEPRAGGAELAEGARDVARDEDAGAETESERADERSRRASAHATIAGSVLVPAGAPADETLEVVALYGNDLAEKTEERDPLLRELGAHEVREHVALGADGRFELPRPAKVKLALFFVRGRYLRLAEPRSLVLDGSGERVDGIVLEPVLGAWLTGRLIPPVGGEEDAPDAAGAELELILTESEEGGFAAFFSRLGRGASAVLDEELAFEVVAAPTGGELLVLLDPKVFPPLVARVPALGPGEARAIELVPLRGARVEGRVVDEDGKPLEGVSVREERRNFGFPGGSAREAESDADGRFALRGLRAGAAILRASRDDRPQVVGDELELEEGVTRSGLVIVMPAGGRIAGRVLWPDGVPAARAQILARALAGGSSQSARADEEGRFEVVGLVDGPHAVDAWLAPRAGSGAKVLEADAKPSKGPDPEAWWARAESVDPALASAAALELELEPPLEVLGRVVDDLGAPVERFVVGARQRGGSAREQRFDAADGSFRLGGLRPGRWTLQASSQESGGRGEELALELPADTGPHELVLARSAVVSGIVVDPLGAPVANARVQATGPRSANRKITDDAGRFHFDELAAEGTTLLASAEGWAPSEATALEALPGEERSDLVLALRRGGTIAGLVLGPDGAPDAGAQITAFGGPGGAGPGGSQARSDAEGRFLLEGLAPGPWQVAAMPEIGTMLERFSGPTQSDPASFLNEMRMSAVEVLEGETVEVVLGRPPEAPVELVGRVVEAGLGVARVTVLAFREGEAIGAGMRAATTDEEGHFSLQLPAPGPVVLLVQSEIWGDGASFPIDVPEVERHEVELALPGGRIAGFVRDARGRPAPGVRVTIAPEIGAAVGPFARFGGDVTTEGDGSFSIRRLRPGRYALRAEAQSLGSAFHPGLVLEAGGALVGLELVLAEPGELRGRVRRADGTPAANAAVFARDEGGHVHSAFTRTQTDASGRFVYDGLPAGRWSASARLEALASGESAAVLVGPDATPEVELALAPGTTLVVVLEGEAGEVLRATISVIDEAGREHAGLGSRADFGRMMAQGFSTREQRIGPLPPGRYVVSALGPDGLLRKKPVTLSGQDERKLVLRVE